MLIEILNRATEKMALGDYQGTIQDTTTILLKLPEYLPALLLRAEARKNMAHYNGAMNDLSAIIMLNHDDPYNVGMCRVYSLQAEIKKIQGDLQGALRDIVTALHINPEYKLSQEMQDAITRELDCPNAVIASPTTASSASLYATLPQKRKKSQSHTNQGKKTLTEDAATSLTIQNNTNIFLNNNIFVINSIDLPPNLADENQLMEDAIKQANLILTMKDVDIIAYIILEEATFATQLWKNNSISEMLTIIRQSPKYLCAAHLTQQANKKLAARAYIEAIALATASLRFCQDYEFAYAVRFEARSLVKDYPGTLEDITQVIQFKPDYEPAYIKRAFIYLLLKHYEEVISDVDQALSLSPSYDGVPYKLRAAAYQALGKPGKAFLEYYTFYRLQKNRTPFSLKELTLFSILENHNYVMETKFNFFRGNLNELKKVLLSVGVTSDTIAAIRGYQGYPEVTPTLFDKIKQYQEKTTTKCDKSAQTELLSDTAFTNKV